ncbi:MAG: NAD(P)H-binding protein, partial [Gammaproteobacteria bacterium]|nr:NAD(P)H-binding protein [Gammaproteobacteria bacterium]
MSAPGPVLVLGATGTVGSVVVERLAASGVAVRAASRRPRTPAPPGVAPLALDLRDPRAVAGALSGARRLLLLTPLEEDMTAIAARVIEQAADAGVEYAVRLSAFGAGEPPLTRLGAVHRETERALETSGIAFAALRPNAFMQNFVTQLAPAIRDGDAFRACQGEGRVSMVDARDVAEIAASMLTSDQPAVGAFELTGPVALSYDDAAAVLSGVLGRPIAYHDEPVDHTRTALLATGLSPWLVA